MSSAMKTLRSNRALLKRNQDSFNIKGYNTFREKPLNEYTKYSFKEATPAYLTKLRVQLKRDKSKRALKRSIAFVVSIGITLYLAGLLNRPII